MDVGSESAETNIVSEGELPEGNLDSKRDCKVDWRLEDGQPSL